MKIIKAAFIFSVLAIWGQNSTDDMADLQSKIFHNWLTQSNISTHFEFLTSCRWLLLSIVGVNIHLPFSSVSDQFLRNIFSSLAVKCTAMYRS